jgi:hypothetical protein
VPGGHCADPAAGTRGRVEALEERGLRTMPCR